MGWLFWVGYVCMGLWIGPRVAQWVYARAVAEAPSSLSEARVFAACLGTVGGVIWPLVLLLVLMVNLLDTSGRNRK